MKRLIAFFKEPPAWFALLWALLTGGMIVLSAAVSTSGAKEEPFAAVLYGCLLYTSPSPRDRG